MQPATHALPPFLRGQTLHELNQRFYLSKYVVPERFCESCKSSESFALGSTVECLECNFFAPDVVDVDCVACEAFGGVALESLEASTLHPTLG